VFKGHGWVGHTTELLTARRRNEQRYPDVKLDVANLDLSSLVVGLGPDHGTRVQFRVREAAGIFTPPALN